MPRQSRDDPHSAPIRVLAIAGIAPQMRAGEEGVAVREARYKDITPALLAEIRPALVLAPLVSARFDAFDVAEALTAAGYAGRYCVVVGRLPDPGLVRREFDKVFPRLDFELVVLEAETS